MKLDQRICTRMLRAIFLRFKFLQEISLAFSSFIPLVFTMFSRETIQTISYCNNGCITVTNALVIVIHRKQIRLLINGGSINCSALNVSHGNELWTMTPPPTTNENPKKRIRKKKRRTTTSTTTSTTPETIKWFNSTFGPDSFLPEDDDDDHFAYSTSSTTTTPSPVETNMEVNPSHGRKRKKKLHQHVLGFPDEYSFGRRHHVSRRD